MSDKEFGGMLSVFRSSILIFVHFRGFESFRKLPNTRDLFC